jgi:3-oxoacyl-[acyl-carrier-protein] synthase-3
MKNIQIVGSGVALPGQVVESFDIDIRLGLPEGSTQRESGVERRYHAKSESATDLAVVAIDMALKNAAIGFDEVDCLIAASGTMEQAIPYNAALIHARLAPAVPIPAFDINMTCLSSLMALDMAATLIDSAQYQCILIVSSEITSVGIDWKDPETRGLFGDGAGAMILRSGAVEQQGILSSHFATYSEGVDYCQILGGGSANHPSKIKGSYEPYSVFKMQGKQAFRLTSQVIDRFVDDLFAKSPLPLDQIDWVVPHQASRLALDHLRKRMGFSRQMVIDIFSHRGNQVAASLPSALHELRVSGNLRAGQRLLMIGTSAGLSLGGLVLQI